MWWHSTAYSTKTSPEALHRFGSEYWSQNPSRVASPGSVLQTAATMSDDIMNKRQKAIDEHYEAQWDTGKGSHHPDYDPEAVGDGVAKANRETEELLNAIIKVRAPTTLPRPSSRDPRSA